MIHLAPLPQLPLSQAEKERRVNVADLLTYVRLRARGDRNRPSKSDWQRWERSLADTIQRAM